MTRVVAAVAIMSAIVGCAPTPAPQQPMPVAPPIVQVHRHMPSTPATRRRDRMIGARLDVLDDQIKRLRKTIERDGER